MPLTHHGDKETGAARMAVVVSRYNETITQQLLLGALHTLAKYGVSDDHVEVVWVPGAWEIPLAAALAVKSRRFAAIICLGAVIRGETTHDQYINRFVSQSLGQLALDYGIPVSFGVLTCNSLEQALQRAGGTVGNKGIEAAEAALEMTSLLRDLPWPAEDRSSHA